MSRIGKSRERERVDHWMLRARVGAEGERNWKMMSKGCRVSLWDNENVLT